MNTYFVARWGNAADGPNGPDTNFLVVAETVEEAGRLADCSLRDHPWHCGPNVQDFVNLVVELGSSVVEAQGVMHGPWIMNAILRGHETALTWRRELRPTEPWERLDLSVG